MYFVLVFTTQGEKDKFEQVYHKYKRLMLHKAYGILNDYRLAEDIVSEAFIRVYQNLHKIDEPISNNTAAYVVTITKNLAITAYNKQKKSVLQEMDDAIVDPFNLEDYILSEVSTAQIYTCLDHLNEDLKTVFLLKYAYDMNHNEIGKTLQITENNVTVKLHRARKKLMDILVKEGYANER